MITLKVDLNMPYLPQNTVDERVDGEITVDGQVYKYVKRRIENGQLVLLCIPDDQRTRLESAEEEYFSLANNVTAKDHPSAPKVQKSTPSDYYQLTLDFRFVYTKTTVQYDLAANQPLNRSCITDCPERPPAFT